MNPVPAIDMVKILIERQIWLGMIISGNSKKKILVQIRSTGDIGVNQWFTFHVLLTLFKFLYFIKLFLYQKEEIFHHPPPSRKKANKNTIIDDLSFKRDTDIKCPEQINISDIG